MQSGMALNAAEHTHRPEAPGHMVRHLEAAVRTATRPWALHTVHAHPLIFSHPGHGGKS